MYIQAAPQRFSAFVSTTLHVTIGFLDVHPGQHFSSLFPLHYMSLLASRVYIRAGFSSLFLLHYVSLLASRMYIRAALQFFVSATLLVTIGSLDVHPGSASVLCAGY